MDVQSDATMVDGRQEASSGAVRTARQVARAIHTGLALLLPIGLVIQVFLAGLGVFDRPASFATHRDVGYLLSMIPFLLAVAGLIGGVPRRLTGLAVAIFVLFMVQSLLVGMRASAPSVAALHPVNGFLITVLALLLARDAWRGRRGPVDSSR